MDRISQELEGRVRGTEKGEVEAVTCMERLHAIIDAQTDLRAQVVHAGTRQGSELWISLRTSICPITECTQNSNKRRGWKRWQAPTWITYSHLPAYGDRHFVASVWPSHLDLPGRHRGL